MLPQKNHLLDYLETLTGERHVLMPEKAAGLPLFLRERYQISSINLFGRRFLFALESDNWDAGSPGEYAKQGEALRSKLGEPVVLVVPALPSYARNRMVRLGIPFIVPGSQMFLPTAMIDLRERFSQPKPGRGEKLTPAAQCVVLSHLQRQSIENLPLRDIAKKIGYSPIMLTNVKDELEAAEVCKATRQGRSLALQFNAHGRQLWEQLQPLLSSPVKKTHWLFWEKPGPPAIVAGVTALSQRTMIADDRIPTFALASANYQANLERGLYRGCRGPEDANVRMESWSYNPLLLGDEKQVDPLSLYLSLRDSADERIQQQLEAIIKQIAW